MALGAPVVDLGPIGRLLNRPVRGIIGFGRLRLQPVTIDYHLRALTFHDPRRFRKPDGARSSRILLRHGIPVMKVRNGQELLLWVQIDTGANAHLSLPWKCVEKRRHLVAGKVNLQSKSRGVAGQVKDLRSPLDSITVFGFELQDIPMTI